MGLAASQARLLTITARLADNELRSQTINNAKMRLSSQSAKASENYINALNNATMTFANYDEIGNELSQALTFNALSAYSSYNTQYGLVNSAGQILVSEDEAKIFAASGNNLNNYLKAHGLEYKTTYFKELGSYQNAAYPAPFNNISVEDLENFYEKYNSYENSVELENYEKLYPAFVSAKNKLNEAGKNLLSDYVLNKNARFAKTDDKYTLNYTTPNNVNNSLKDIREVFGHVDENNNYDFNSGFLYDLKNANYIDNVIFDYAVKKINNIEVKNCTEIDQNGNSNSYYQANFYSDINDLNDNNIKTTDANNNTIYTFDDGLKVTVNPSGHVIAFDTSVIEENNTDTENPVMTYSSDFSFTYDATDPKTLEQVINDYSYSVTITDETEGTSKKDCAHRLKDGVYQSYFSIKDNDSQLTEVLNNIVDSIISTILNGANYDKFLNDIQKDYNNLGLTINKATQNLFNAYTESKNAFFGFIFNDEKTIGKVQQYIDTNDSIEIQDTNGNKVQDKVISIENLTDIEFILQLVRAKSDDKLSFSSKFETVIKEYLMDMIIEENGTPNYAWLDENDTSNTGNADAKAQWYTNLFKRMQQGYKVLENGLANSKDWIEYALQSGIVTMEQVDKAFVWKGIDYKTCTKITEVTDDAAVAKAEAEYTRAMNDIKAKDHIYDMQLKNIDTEHSSLQTEYEVIKGVISKNIERTMKFNQSA